jgi:hypothetical protein
MLAYTVVEAFDGIGFPHKLENRLRLDRMILLMILVPLRFPTFPTARGIGRAARPRHARGTAGYGDFLA